MTALADRNYLADRDAARTKRRGATLYPRLTVFGSTWVRQDHAGGPMDVIPQPEAERPPISQEAAA